MSSMLTTPQQVQNYLRDTLTFFRTHIRSLFILVFPYAVLSELFFRLVIQPLPDNEKLFSSLMAEMILYPILQTVLTLFMAASVSGQPRSVKECYLFSVQFWPRILMLTIITTMGVMSGLSLFIVPGIYLMIRMTMSDMFCVLDGKNVLESVRLSFAATVPVTWVIFLGLLMLFPAVTALSLGLSQVSHSLDNPITSVLISTIQALLHTIFSIYLFRVFMAVRNQH